MSLPGQIDVPPVRRLRELGGIAGRGTLPQTCTRRRLERSVEVGDIVRLSRGRYGLAGLDEAARIAGRLGGVLCLSSAALHHGGAVKCVPDRPQLMFSRGRRIPRSDPVGVHWGELAPGQVEDGVTTPEPGEPVVCRCAGWPTWRR